MIDYLDGGSTAPPGGVETTAPSARRTTRSACRSLSTECDVSTIVRGPPTPSASSNALDNVSVKAASSGRDKDDDGSSSSSILGLRRTSRARLKKIVDAEVSPCAPIG